MFKLCKGNDMFGIQLLCAFCFYDAHELTETITIRRILT